MDFATHKKREKDRLTSRRLKRGLGIDLFFGHNTQVKSEIMKVQAGGTTHIAIQEATERAYNLLR